MSLPVKADTTITIYKIQWKIRLLSPQRQYHHGVGGWFRETHFNTCIKKSFPYSHTKNFFDSTTIIRTCIAIQFTVGLVLSTKGCQSLGNPCTYSSSHLAILGSQVYVLSTSLLNRAISSFLLRARSNLFCLSIHLRSSRLMKQEVGYYSCILLLLGLCYPTSVKYFHVI